jgi:alpha-L-arabinofuranosidase
VMMDKENPYVGEHTPSIQLDGSGKKGLRQAGPGLKKGRVCSGYILLAGEDATIQISLVWGSEVDQSQSVKFDHLSSDFSKYIFQFIAGSDTDDAVFEISGTGNGYFKVGAASLMPADNLKGYRSDIVNLLKELNSGIYRWPGGNMPAGYNWRDGIGDRDKRPPRYDYAWNAVESNDVGTDEYLDLCDLLNIDPYLGVNIGFGDDFSAAQWVEYVNGDTTTLMGNWRAQNGHPEPYGVEWWGIGNEMYGQWQLGHMSIGHYILKHNYFAEAMRKVDPNIKLIASGAKKSPGQDQYCPLGNCFV